MTRMWVLCALVVAVGCGGEPDMGPEVQPPTCAEKQEAFDELVAANQACESASECRVVGFIREDCNYGTDYVAAVHVSIAGSAQQRLEGMKDCLPATVDDFDQVDVACIDNLCTIERTRQSGCFPADAGPDGGTADAGPDGGTADAGPDGGTPDAGAADAGTPDASAADAATADAA